MRKKRIGIGIILCGILLVAGCIQTTYDNAQAGVSSTEIRICDSPSENFSNIYITFSEVKLFSNETSWISFLSEPKVIDLMYLHKNNLTEQLGLKDVAIGNYTSLWIMIDNAIGVLSSTEETVYFDIPSNTLKIQHLFDFHKGNNTITVDIDLDESILIYNVSDNAEYKLLPVLSELKVNCANGTQIQFRNNERIMNFANGTQIRVQDENTLRNMIENRKPTIDLLVNGNRSNHITIDINKTITFDASKTFDIDADILSFFWDFDDGITSTEPLVTHSYAVSGIYNVTLTVSDFQIEDTAVIMVTARPSGQGEGESNNPSE